jgi:ketosteroid isomerase-like protein
MSSLTKEEMDQVISDHLGFEAKDDVEGVLSTLSDDVVHDLVGMPWGPQNGHEGARKNYEFFFPNMKVEDIREVKRLYGDDFLVFDCEVDALLSGAVAQREEAQGRATFRVLHVFEFTDGKISRENVWADFVTMAQSFTPV